MDTLEWDKTMIEAIKDRLTYERFIVECVKRSLELEPPVPGSFAIFIGGTKWKKRQDIEQIAFEDSVKGPFPLKNSIEQSLKQYGAIIWDLTPDALLMLIYWHHGCGFPSLIKDFPHHLDFLPKTAHFPAMWNRTRMQTTLEKIDHEDHKLGTEIISQSLAAERKYNVFSPEELRLLEGFDTGIGCAENYWEYLANGKVTEDNSKHAFFDRDNDPPVDILNREKRTPLEIFDNRYDPNVDSDFSYLEDADFLIGDKPILAESIQLGLLRILLLAEKFNCEQLWNEAMDAFRLGEKAMHRSEVVWYHIDVVFRSEVDSPLLKQFLIDYFMYLATLRMALPGFMDRLEAYPEARKMAGKIAGRPELVPGLDHNWNINYLGDVVSAKCAYHKHGWEHMYRTNLCPVDCWLAPENTRQGHMPPKAKKAAGKSKIKGRKVHFETALEKDEKKPEKPPEAKSRYVKMTEASPLDEPFAEHTFQIDTWHPRTGAGDRDASLVVADRAFQTPPAEDAPGMREADDWDLGAVQSALQPDSHDSAVSGLSTPQLSPASSICYDNDKERHPHSPSGAAADTLATAPDSTSDAEEASRHKEGRL